MLFLFLLAAPACFSQEISGENLEIRLMVVGQGDPVYSLWGHTGLAIRNKENGKDVFYDFGNFNFEDDDFFTNFAIGRLLYIAWASFTEQYIFSTINDKRDLTEYVLNLSPEKKQEMYEALRLKAKPENRTYLYHHYNDNCSTRIRDYIDIAVNGQLNARTDYSRGSTFRRSFLRFTSNKKVTGFFLSLLQGPMIDKEVTLWQEMFLPDVLGEVVSSFDYKNDKGEIVPLVTQKNRLYNADQRLPLPETYKPDYLIIALISLILSSMVLIMNIISEKGNRAWFACLNIIMGLFLGLLGSVLLFLAAFTDHSYSFNNMNLFMINPLALLLIPAAVLYWIKGDLWKKRMNVIWMIQVGLTITMIIIKIITPVKQDNLSEIILFLPVLVSFTRIIPDVLNKRGLLR
jgi:hypothetical protein